MSATARSATPSPERRARLLRDAANPDAIAAASTQEIGRAVDYRPVAVDGAGRAAAMIAELLR